MRSRGAGIIDEEAWGILSDWITPDEVSEATARWGGEGGTRPTSSRRRVAEAFARFRLNPEFRRQRPNEVFEAIIDGRIAEDSFTSKPSGPAARVLPGTAPTGAQLGVLRRMVLRIWRLVAALRRAMARASGAARRGFRKVMFHRSAERRTRQANLESPIDPLEHADRMAQVRARVIREKGMPRNEIVTSDGTAAIKGAVRLQVWPTGGILPLVRTGGAWAPVADSIGIKTDKLPGLSAAGQATIEGDVAADLPLVGRYQLEWRSGRWHAPALKGPPPAFTHVRIARDPQTGEWSLWVHKAPETAAEAILESARQHEEIPFEEVATDPQLRAKVLDRVRDLVPRKKAEAKELEKHGIPLEKEQPNGPIRTAREDENGWKIWPASGSGSRCRSAGPGRRPRKAIHLMRRAMNESKSSRARATLAVTENYHRPLDGLSQGDQEIHTNPLPAGPLGGVASRRGTGPDRAGSWRRRRRGHREGGEGGARRPVPRHRPRAAGAPGIHAPFLAPESAGDHRTGGGQGRGTGRP